MDAKASLKGVWLSHVNHLNFGGHNHISGTADRLRHCHCQLTSPVSVINFWRSAAVLITSTVEICIQHLGRVEEMGFAARRSYASAVLGVVILSVRPSVRHTRALWLIPRTYRRYFYTTRKGNLSSQMWFFVQLCSSWQDFNWLEASRGPSAIAELLVGVSIVYWLFVYQQSTHHIVDLLLPLYYNDSLLSCTRFVCLCVLQCKLTWRLETIFNF